jgi:hypothetical protein
MASIKKTFTLPLLAGLFLSVLPAQETPTERQAARDVIAKLNALEKSLDINALVTKLTAPNAEREKVVARAKQLMDTEMLALGDQITRDPEIGFKEERAVRVLTERLTNTMRFEAPRAHSTAINTVRKARSAWRRRLRLRSIWMRTSCREP